MEKRTPHSDHILPSDAAHGNRGGGPMHALASADAAGFMSAADKAALDGLVAGIPGSLVELFPETSVGTGTTYSVTDLATGYRRLHVVCVNMSHNGGVAQDFRVGFSGNNGVSYTTMREVVTGVAAADAFSNTVVIENADTTTSKTMWNGNWFWWNYVGAPANAAINAVKIDWSGGANFDTGTIKIYGEVA